MRITKTKIAVAVASAAVVALGSTAAYAYFTTTGTGTGSAAVGTNVPVTGTVFLVDATNPLVPDGAAHALGYTITNPATFAQSAHAAHVTITEIDDKNGVALSDPTLCDISIVDPTIPAGATVGGGKTVTVTKGATGSLSMGDNNKDQSACEGATIKLSVALS